MVTASSVQRHDLYDDYGYAYMGPDEVGNWVKHADHESALSALREENERLRALIWNARDYVDAALTHERAAFKGYEHASDIAFLEQELVQIDAALTPKEQGNG